MRKVMLGLAAISALLFIGSGFASAEDSVNIRVSCTIPAIPGINSPLLETQSIALKTEPEQPLPNIQEETENDDQSSEGEKDIVLVKTFYVR